MNSNPSVSAWNVAEMFLSAASDGRMLTADEVNALRSSQDTWNNLSDFEKWSFWSRMAALDNPSVVLQSLHQCGWDSHFPEWVAVRDVPQDPVFHPEGPVHVHLEMAADFAAQQATADDLNEADRLVVVLAAFCHDFGKSTHTQCHADGRITSVNHDQAGGPLARSFLVSVGAPSSVVDAVVVLVQEHMRHVLPPTSRGVTRLESRLAEHGATLDQLVRVFDADTGGRGSNSSSGAGDAWLAVRKERDDRRNAVRKREPLGLLDATFLQSLGFTPGPLFGEVVNAYRALETPVADEDLADWVRAWMRENAS